MRTLLGVIAGITLAILWHTIGWPFIGWAFTRIEPDAIGTPRHRHWVNGEEVT